MVQKMRERTATYKEKVTNPEISSPEVSPTACKLWKLYLFYLHCVMSGLKVMNWDCESGSPVGLILPY